MAPRQLRAAALLAAVAFAQDRPTHEEYKEAKAAEAADAAAADAKQAKMAAVDKVVNMLEELKGKVMKEGEEEAATYNKFACFCKDTTKEKTDAIQKGTDEQQSLSTSIEDLATERSDLDTEIETLEGDITAAEDKIKELKETRAEALKEYEKNAKELSDGIAALNAALQALKASKGASLLQLQNIGKTLQNAVFLADALGLDAAGVEKAASVFLQQAPDVPMEDYKFHSKGIIDMLETLLKDFRAEKTTLDEDEVTAVHEHDTNVQEQTIILKEKNTSLDKAKKSKATKQAQISELSAQRTTVAATLLDDQKYLSELAAMCKEKGDTWDQRTKVRADELSALASAITIIKEQVGEKTSAATLRFAQQGVAVRLAHAMAKNPEAMEAAEADAEAADESDGAPPSLLQKAQRFLAPVRSSSSSASKEAEEREALANLMRTKGTELKSTLLASLVSHVMEDPFAKVTTLIEELINRLQQEAANEATQKGWCDKSISEAEDRRNAAAEAIQELNGQMAEQEAVRDKLKTEVAELQAAIEDLKTKQEEATKIREDEKKENEETVSEAKEGLEAVESAITILKEFYDGAAKEKVESSLLEKGPGDDAPDAGFKGGEAYTGAQDGATGVLGMLDVIKSDFDRTIAETEKAEAKAEEDHQTFMAETDTSIAEKSSAEEQKNTQLSDTEAALEEADGTLKSESEALTNAVKELLELKPTCIDTGMSYDERVARREDELVALKKGLCILENYNQYAPGNAAAKSC